MNVGLRELLRGGVGENVPRIDGIPKVSGTFAYASDLGMDGMLWGATLRSPYPHAAIRGIDIGGALASPGVHAVLLASDIPGQNRFGLNFDDQPVLADAVVRYDGEPVAVVAAETAELARRAISRIGVEYEPLQVLADMEEALRAGAPRLHEFGNVLRHVHLLHGDPDAVAADHWVGGYYETAMQDQAPLGPEAGLAVPAEDGGVDLYVATQWLHVDREQIAPCLRLPEEKVRLHLAGVGGAFGSREDIHMQIHASLLALRTGRPVKMSFGREESFHSHVHRHPSRIWMRHGVTAEGRLLSVDARLLFDGGAYTSSSPAVVGNAATFAAGPYDVPNVRVEGTVVYTNNPPCGAMRGFGGPQVCFAHEAQMDKIAARIGIDPVELRLANALKTGSVLPTGQVLTGAAPVREIIEGCRDLPLPQPDPARGRDILRYPGGTGAVTRGEGLKRGVGFAVGYKNVAFSEGFDDSAAARVTLSFGPDGPVAEIYTAAVEMGQGLYTLLTQIVRTELGVDRVVFHPADTLVGNAGSTSASRQSMMSGGAVQLACAQVRGALFDRACAHLGPVGREDLVLEDGQVFMGGSAGAARSVGPVGDALPAGAEGPPVVDIGAFLGEPIERGVVYRHRATEHFDENGQGDIHVSFAFAAERAVVEVDEELGLVRVLQVAAAVDAGRVLNPSGFEGQIEGGTAQGLGLALMEEVQVREGIIRNPSFTDYLIPTILDMPPVVSMAIEAPEPGVPYGLKGIGESPTVVATAAIVAALRDATGRELNRAPVSPDELAGLRGPAPSAGAPPPPKVPGQWPVPYYHDMQSGQQRLM
ncbi:MAG TPA: xanthine dehydrogenase subunit D [Streptosporangiaceae bacterium]|nr:xanthine dehydrogenase subunit D [Streptosporangiaceae bacterium]